MDNQKPYIEDGQTMVNNSAKWTNSEIQNITQHTKDRTKRTH